MKTERILSWILVSAAFVSTTLAKVGEENTGKRVAKQIHSKATLIDSTNDHKASETGFHGGDIGHGHGKFFQYQHNPEHDHYEFGYRRGNEHHFQERYEKAAPHHGHFKTKARWGDKHGGYGEHYWDYNHAGHGHDDGGDDHGEGGYSEPVPNYHPQPGKVNAKRELEAASSNPEEQRVKRQHKPKFSTTPRLVFDLASGKVIDEATGQAYILKPVH